MFPKQFPELKTERLKLRRIVEGDTQPMIEIASFKVKNAQKKDATDLMERTEKAYEEKQGITWALSLEGHLIGTVGYYRGFKNASGEVGYVMCEAFKRKGYMSEAVVAAINYGFNTLKLNRITAFTKPDNLASVSMLEKLGFKNTQEIFEGYVIFEIKRINFLNN